MRVSERILIGVLLVWVASSSCFMGEYYNRNNGTCQQCDISCESCSSAEGCSTCYDQMYLSPVGNKVLCKVCYEVNINCESCLSSQKCSACSTGYYVNSNNTCSPCSQHTSNCLFCNQNGTSVQCITCNLTFTLINGRCVNQNGTSRGNNTTTQSQASSNRSQGNPRAINQNNLKEQGGQIAVSCLSNQVQISGVCVLAIPFCIQYNLTTKKCSVCTSECILSDFGYCVPLILFMNSNNPIKTSNQQVVSIISTSLKVEKNITAADCTENQYFWYGQCVTIGTQCLQEALNGTCQKCILGYKVQRGLCVQIPPNHQSTNSVIPEPSQTPAHSSSTPGSAVALKTNANCKSPCLTCAQSNNEECLTCIQGYTTVDLFPGKCFLLN